MRDHETIAVELARAEADYQIARAAVVESYVRLREALATCDRLSEEYRQALARQRGAA